MTYLDRVGLSHVDQDDGEFSARKKVKRKGRGLDEIVVTRKTNSTFSIGISPTYAMNGNVIRRV